MAKRRMSVGGPRAATKLSRVVGLVLTIGGLTSTGIGIAQLVGANPAVPGGGEAIPSVEVTPTDPLAGWASCANTTLGYSLRYPPDWITKGDGDDACRYFDTVDFDLPVGDARANAAIRIRRTGQTVEGFRADLKEPSGFTVVKTEDITIDGHDAVVVLTSVKRASGAVKLLYSYLVAFEDVALEFNADEVLSADFARTGTVLEEMMQTVRFS